MKGYIELKLTPSQMIEIENILSDLDDYWEKMEEFIKVCSVPKGEEYLWSFDNDSFKDKYRSIPDIPDNLIYEKSDGQLYRRKKDWVEDLRKIYKLFINNPRDFTVIGDDKEGSNFYYEALVDQDVVNLLDDLDII